MSRAVELIWAGGTHEFLLDIGSLRSLQEATGRGPMEIYNALGNAAWRVDDVLSTLRCGLIGGGMALTDARALMMQVTDTTPLLSLAMTAHLVIAAALTGPTDDVVGAPSGEQKGAAAPPVG